MTLGSRRGQAGDAGFTVVEILVVVALIAVLSSIALTVYRDSLEKARVTRAIAEIRGIEKALTLYKSDKDALPDTLADIDAQYVDPWGTPYQYLPLSGLKGLPGKARKDRFKVPLNSDYDLYSMGPDGLSVGPLTAKQSRDDIVRAADGAFVGIAEDF